MRYVDWTSRRHSVYSLQLARLKDLQICQLISHNTRCTLVVAIVDGAPKKGVVGQYLYINRHGNANIAYRGDYAGVERPASQRGHFLRA